MTKHKYKKKISKYIQRTNDYQYLQQNKGQRTSNQLLLYHLNSLITNKR